MPYVFLAAGLALVITSIEGTYNALGTQLKKDFTGKGGFQFWALAILMIGALGYVEELRPLANKLLALVLIVLFIVNKGAFTNLLDAFQKGAISPAKNATTQTAPAAIGSWQTTTESAVGAGKSTLGNIGNLGLGGTALPQNNPVSTLQSLGKLGVNIGAFFGL